MVTSSCTNDTNFAGTKHFVPLMETCKLWECQFWMFYCVLNPIRILCSVLLLTKVIKILFKDTGPERVFRVILRLWFFGDKDWPAFVSVNNGGCHQITVRCLLSPPGHNIRVHTRHNIRLWFPPRTIYEHVKHGQKSDAWPKVIRLPKNPTEKQTEGRNLIAPPLFTLKNALSGFVSEKLSSPVINCNSWSEKEPRIGKSFNFISFPICSARKELTCNT